MIAPLIQKIIDESEGEFTNFRLKQMKYSLSQNQCDIVFNYRKNADQDHRRIEDYAKLFLPDGITYRFLYTQVLDNEESVIILIRSILSSRFAIDTTADQFSFGSRGVTVTLTTDQYCHCVDVKAGATLTDALDTEFCRAIEIFFADEHTRIDAAEIAEELMQDMLEKSEPTAMQAQRVIMPFNIEKYIGETVEPPAAYIMDLRPDPDAKVVVCGTLSNVRMETRPSAKSPGKTFTIFRATLTDYTGSVSCFTFVSESVKSKYEELDVSTPVMIFGVADKAFNSSDAEVKISRISYCELPKDFQEAVYKREVPNRYTRLIPQPYIVTKQQTLFDAQTEEKPNPFFRGKTFVVLDTETTGISRRSDRIVEIACVKIADGMITEYLHTMVNPKMHIPEEASRINHITDDMVENAPSWEELVGDIFKFCDGCIIVGHNVNFDMDMINNTARETHFHFEHRTMDTLRMAQQKVHGVRNYTLATLLKHFDLVNENAHRAFEDTVATAKLFIKLVNL